MKAPEIIYTSETSGRIFTEQEMQNTYNNNANKVNYPDFETWISVMISNGIYKKEKVIGKLKHNNNEPAILKGNDIL